MSDGSLHGSDRTAPITVGVIGAGMIGGTLAMRLAAAGHHVLLANRTGEDALRDLTDEIGANAEPSTSGRAAADSEVTVLAVPFAAVMDFPSEHFVGKIVIDATNYYEGRDGHVRELASGSITSSELTARALPGARVVKAFNMLHFAHLRDDWRPSGAADRLAVLMAGDDATAKAVVARLIDDVGFDPVDAGSLAAGGRRQQPGTALYNKAMTRAAVEAIARRLS